LLLKKIMPESAYARVSRLYKKGKSYCYYGNKRECTVCGGRFRLFLPAGASNRPNAKCPRCYSLERHRLMFAYFLNCTDVFKENKRILHFAPEYCFQEIFTRAENLDYHTADIAATNAMYHINIEEIPFEDGSFDIVVANHVLEHVDNDIKAMKEVFRVLKPDGWALLQVPLDVNRATTFEDETIVSHEERTRAFGQFDHVRLYGRDYGERLKAAGFKVEVVVQEDFLSPDMIVKYGLFNSEDMYVCRKC